MCCTWVCRGYVVWCGALYSRKPVKHIGGPCGTTVGPVKCGKGYWGPLRYGEGGIVHYIVVGAPAVQGVGVAPAVGRDLCGVAGKAHVVQQQGEGGLSCSESHVV